MTLFRTFPSGPSLRRAVAVAAVATLPIAAVAVPPASAASTLETVSFTTPGATSWTVPSGACNVTVVAVGVAGGHANGGTVFGTWTGASGGDGAEIRMANYPVLPGDSVSIVVGATAADIDNQTSIGTDAGLAAAGGGGATTVNLADPALRDGWHADQNGHRWTKGLASLPVDAAPIWQNATQLELLVRPAARYPRRLA